MLVALALLVAAPLAAAAVIDIDDALLTGANGSKWDPASRETAWCINGEPNAFTPIADGSTSSRDDAFDNGLILVAGTKPFKDSDGDGRLKGQTLKAGPEKLAGLRVSVVETALQTSATLRVLYKLKNARNHKVSQPLALDSNLGSDNDTRIESTSSGDNAFTKADRWLVTSDAPDPLGVDNDPPVTHALFGKDASARVEKINETPAEPCEGGPTGYLDDMVATFRTAVPAHGTRYLLFFAELNDSNAAAVAAADKFNPKHLNADLLKGLGSRTRNRVLNWSL